jgi:hypothetical protein
MQYGTHDNSAQRHAAIELHDSDLVALCQEPSALILDLRACVHRSHGTPGTDLGSVWVQPASIILSNARLSAPTPVLPCAIADANVSTDSHAFDNLIPCPFAWESETTVSLTLASGQRLQIDADQLEVAFAGEPEFIGDFDVP